MDDSGLENSGADDTESSMIKIIVRIFGLWSSMTSFSHIAQKLRNSFKYYGSAWMNLQGIGDVFPVINASPLINKRPSSVSD